jgi:hypothetical protein
MTIAVLTIFQVIKTATQSLIRPVLQEGFFVQTRQNLI